MNNNNLKKNKYASIKSAIALRYNPENNNSPEIIAKGVGLISDKIIEKAKESNIPIFHDPELAETLISFNLGDEIPPELYEVVAEILVFVGNLDKKYGDIYDPTR